MRARFGRWRQDGRLYAVLSAAGFSLKAVFVKLGYATAAVDALTLLALRMLLALPLFLWLIWLSRDQGQPMSARDWGRMLLLGAAGYYLSSLFDFYGLEYISAGLERMILYLYPTLVLLFQAILQRQRPGVRVLQAMAICYLGLGVAFVHDLGVIGHGARVMAGAAWVFASAMTYALYYIGTGAMLRRIGSMRLAGLAGAASAVMVLGHYLLTESPSQLAALPSAVWGYAGLMALLSTVLPVYWLAIAVQRMGVAQAAALGNLGPVLTLIAAWLLLAEPLSLYQVAGLALVLFGVSRLKPASAPARPAAASQSGA